MSNAGVEVRRMKREKELSVIWIEVLVDGKGRDKSTERSGVHYEEYRTENRALRDAAAAGVQGRQIIITFHTEGEVGLKPI